MQKRERRTKRIQLVVTETLFDDIKLAAWESQHSVNDFINKALEHATQITFEIMEEPDE